MIKALRVARQISGRKGNFRWNLQTHRKLSPPRSAQAGYRLLGIPPRSCRAGRMFRK